jgi:hypothetical protein
MHLEFSVETVLRSAMVALHSATGAELREREITGAVFSTAVAAARVARAQKVFMVVLKRS